MMARQNPSLPVTASNTNELTLSLTIVPEPSTFALAALGLGRFIH